LMSIESLFWPKGHYKALNAILPGCQCNKCIVLGAGPK